MTQWEKLLQKLRTKPRDFRYDDVKKLLEGYNFVEVQKGKTSGSRVQFVRLPDGMPFAMHKPHTSGSALKAYQTSELVDFVERLERERLS